MKITIVASLLIGLMLLACDSSSTTRSSTDNKSSAEKVQIESLTVIPGEASPVIDDTALASPANPVKYWDYDGISYEVGCIDSILGEAATDYIVYQGRPPEPRQFAKIQDCRRSYQESQIGNLDPNNLADRDHQSDVAPPSDQQEILADWGPQPEICGGKDRDHAGMPLGPQCNVIPEPLPTGVVPGILQQVVLPKSQYNPPVDRCTTFREGQCSELQWELVSDLRAGEFVQIKISSANPDVMYAGTDSNDMTLFRSANGGDSWELVHVKGHAAGLAISPIDSNIALYTNLEAPVQRTEDGGTSWDSVVGHEPDSVHYNNPFTAVAFSDTNPNIVYTAALRGSSRGGIWPPEPADIFKSTDSGRTWDQVGTCETCSSIQTIIVKPHEPDEIWVAADGGVQFSKNGGQTWSGNVIEYLQKVASRISSNTMETMPKVIGLAVHPDRPEIMLAASSEYGVFRSEDGGSSWNHSNAGLETSKLHQVYLAPSDPNVAYLSTHHGIYRSDDAGKSWSRRDLGLPYEFLSAIAIHPTNDNVVFAGTTSEIYTIHPEHLNKGMHQGQGLYKSIDGGRTWRLSDTGIVEAKIAQIGTHPLLPFNIWAGGESGRGNFFSPDGGENWLFSPSITSHYPMVYAFNYELPTVIYTTGWLKTGELTTSTDEGASWYTLTHKLEAGLSEETRGLGLRTEGPSDFHIHGVAVAPSDPNVIYVGSVHDTVYPDLTFNLNGTHIWKSSDQGKTFPEMSNGFPIQKKTSINAIVVHPTNPDIAYVMTTLHETETAIGIYKTTNGAQSWMPVNEGLDPFTNDLQMDSVNPDILYAASESGIYKTLNGAENWVKSSNGIPEGPVIDMAIDPINPLVLYAITPDNLYRTQDGADNWYPVNLGLPLLEDNLKTLSVQERLMNRLRLDRTKTGHSMYGGTFAQDRTLEIDATGRVIVVVVKTNRDDNVRTTERLLYRSVVSPLVFVRYEYLVDISPIVITTQSFVDDLSFDSRINQLSFTLAGPPTSTSRTTVEIPQALLPGSVQIFVDGVLARNLDVDGGVTFDIDHVGPSQVVIKSS